LELVSRCLELVEKGKISSVQECVVREFEV